LANEGWRSQSPWLKVLLAASLLMVAAGIYRCSVELSAPEEGGTVSQEQPADGAESHTDPADTASGASGEAEVD
jgi:hypothetical protein